MYEKEGSRHFFLCAKLPYNTAILKDSVADLMSRKKHVLALSLHGWLVAVLWKGRTSYWVEIGK